MVAVEDLLRLPFFQGFTFDDLSRLLASGRHRIYQNGQVVFGEGLPDDCSLFVAVRGGIRVTIAGKDHQRFVIGNAGEGTVFGEMSFVDSLPRSATITALSSLETVSLSRKGYEELCETDPAVALKLMRRLAHIISTRLRNADKFVAEAKSVAAAQQQAMPAPPPPPPPPPPMKVTVAGRVLDLAKQPDLLQNATKLPDLQHNTGGGLHDSDIKATPNIFHRGDPNRVD